MSLANRVTDQRDLKNYVCFGRIRVRNWIFLIFLLCVSIATIMLCIFVPVLLGTEQYARVYNDASVTPYSPLSRCNSYQPTQGLDSVFQMYQSGQGPAIATDTYWVDSLFLQINPALIKEGHELIIPDTGARPFLGIQRGSWCANTENLKGRLKILRISENAVEAWLDMQLQGELLWWKPEYAWKYTGNMTFENARIPR